MQKKKLLRKLLKKHKHIFTAQNFYMFCAYTYATIRYTILEPSCMSSTHNYNGGLDIWQEVFMKLK